MGLERNLIDQLVDRLDDTVEPVGLADPTFRFATDVVGLIANVGHPIVTEAYAAARLAAEANDDIGLEATRIRCWITLDRDYPGLDTPHPAVSGIRAAILMLDRKRCVLEGEFLEGIDYLLAWVNNVADHSGEELRLARSLFEPLLNGCVNTPASTAAPRDSSADHARRA